MEKRSLAGKRILIFIDDIYEDLESLINGKAKSSREKNFDIY